MRDPKDVIRAYAHGLGFDLVGVTTAQAFQRGRAAEDRARQGLMDGLPWFTVDRVRKASRPQELLPGARSVIALGMGHYIPDEKAPAGTGGNVPTGV